MAVSAARTYRDVEAWQQADDLAHLVYRVTWKFMQSDPGLAQRMRGAAITAATSIAEACRPAARPPGRQGLQAASAALGELGYYLHFARRAGLLGEMDVRRLGALSSTVERHLDALLEGAAVPDGGAPEG